MENKKDKNFVASIRNYIEQNYADKNISIDFFRELTGYSIMHINEVYRKSYWDMTPIEHLHTVRVNEAKKLIKEGVPLGMTASRVGYYSMRTFYRSFEKATGMTPTEYKLSKIQRLEWLRETIGNQPLSPLDYAKKACGTIMLQYDAQELRPISVKEGVSRYSFHQGIFLLGMYNTYKLCDEERYLNYIMEWFEAVTDEDYRIRSFDWYMEENTREILDAYQPIVLLIKLYEETGEEKYIKAVEYIKETFATYPRTKEGILWHARFLPHQIYLNSVYMACPALCMYAKLTGMEDYYDIASIQPIEIYKMLCDEKTGLLWYSHDGLKTAEWADPETGLSTEIFGRALGYYIMGIMDMLEYLPKDHPNRDAIIQTGIKTLDAIAKFQDESGCWYKIVDCGNENGNWLENSSTCMFVYAFAKAINLGLIDRSYDEIVIKGYSGVIDTIEYGEKGEMYLHDIAEGIILGNSDRYINSRNVTNDLLGIGPFVLMCNEVEKLFRNM